MILTEILPDGEYEFEIVATRVEWDRPEAVKRTRVEIDLKCLTGPNVGRVVTDWTNLNNPTGHVILAAKMRKIGIAVPESFGPEIMDRIGPDLRGLRVRVQSRRKTAQNGSDYAFYFYRGRAVTAPLGASAIAGDGAPPAGPGESGRDTGGDAGLDAETRIMAGLYRASVA